MGGEGLKQIICAIKNIARIKVKTLYAKKNVTNIVHVGLVSDWHDKMVLE